jgi:hypothetical protein
MKKIRFGCLLLLMIVSGGCNNSYTVKTKIHPDGSFDRTIVCEGDSLGIFKIALPFVFKNGWVISTEKKNDKTNKFITTATKKYPSADDLQAEWAAGRDSTKLNITSRIDKRFRWFYTYYDYQEIIPAFGLFKQVTPFDSAFTPAEIERLNAGKDSLLKNRLDTYWARNVIAEYIDSLASRSQRLHDPVFAPAQWQEKRAKLADSLLDKLTGKPDNMIAWIEKAFQTPSAEKLRGIIDTTEQEITAKAVIENDLDVSFKNEVVMPGILITSNSVNVEGSKLMWEARPHRFISVVMTAESRTINLWAVIVSAVVCLVLLAGLLLPMIRMRHVRM